MFDMWSTVTSKLESHAPVQTNVQATSVQNQSSGSIKGKFILLFLVIIFYFFVY